MFFFYLIYIFTFTSAISLYGLWQEWCDDIEDKKRRGIYK